MWEYTVCCLPKSPSESEDILDLCGEEGWELVSVVSGYNGVLTAYLKRSVTCANQ